MTKKIILYGAPGAGKDTQAERISKQLNIVSFSLGQILRDEVARGTKLGESIRPFVESGTFISAELAMNIMKDRLLNEGSAGYVLNGYPRTVETVEQFLTFETPTLIVHLRIPDELARIRLAERKRADDTPGLIDAKLKRYHETEEAAVEYFKNHTKITFLEVDGTLPPESITKSITTRLG